jgi:molybdopterin converting factor small subunit
MYPALAGLVQHSAMAVNDDMAEDDRVVEPWADLALLPPVSGG